MTLIGHLGPGSFLLFWGLAITAEAARWRLIVKDKRRKPLAKFVIGVLFVVPATILEIKGRAGGVTGMTNLHHFTLYGLVATNSILNLISILPGHWLPLSLVGVWESLMLGCFGLLFQAHNHGNATFVYFHRFMGLMLCGAAISSFILASYPASAKHSIEVAKYTTGLLIQISGQWFASIGFGFYWYSESDGLLGSKKDTAAATVPAGTDAPIGMDEEAMEALGTVSVYLCIHVAASALLSACVYAALKRFDQIMPDSELRMINSNGTHLPEFDETEAGSGLSSPGMRNGHVAGGKWTAVPTSSSVGEFEMSDNHRHLKAKNSAIMSPDDVAF